MILIDALYINDGGGKILLDYLISNLENSDLKIFYLLDERIKGNHPEIKKNTFTYLKANIFNRHFFYINNHIIFSKVLCFANLPPNIKLKVSVFTYFHSPMYLKIPSEFTLIAYLKFRLKIFILRLLIKNTDFWIVQSYFIKNNLSDKFKIKKEIIKVLPFYPHFVQLEEVINREKYTYLYVSTGTPHKNHKKLIDVFCEFYDKFKIGKLILTVSDDYPDVLYSIKSKISNGYPIENIGFVDRTTLQKKYYSSEFLVFPSSSESFGLGLIEAIECGCKIIAADLPYTYEVCKPSLTFDPLNSKSIFNAFEESLKRDKIKYSLPLIKNEITSIVNLLK